VLSVFPAPLDHRENISRECFVGTRHFTAVANFPHGKENDAVAAKFLDSFKMK
jgi:hypothetical protein